MRVNCNIKKMRAIPRKVLTPWILLGLICLYSAWKLMIPAENWLTEIENVQIDIDKAYIVDSRDIKGSRFMLWLQSGEQVFYLWYPSHAYSQYSDSVESLLHSADTGMVQAMVLSNSTLGDILTGHKKIVDLRSDHAVYYELETEIARTQSNHNNFLVMLILMGLVWALTASYMAIAYNVFTFMRKKIK